jgi:hypothetical protein
MAARILTSVYMMFRSNLPEPPAALGPLGRAQMLSGEGRHSPAHDLRVVTPGSGGIRAQLAIWSRGRRQICQGCAGEVAGSQVERQ